MKYHNVRRRSRRLQAARPAKLGAADAAVAAGSAVAVDALPDELLLLVFSKVADGRTLLDALPLVCKRWCRVARDPGAWAGVELSVADDVADDARVLLHARAAKSLVVHAWPARFPRLVEETATATKRYAAGGMYGPEVCAKVRSALRRSRAVLTESVVILEGGWGIAGAPQPGPASAIAAFLSRQRDLRELRLYLGYGEEAAVLAAVAALRRLQTLQFTTAPNMQYRGALAGKLPELRRLQLHAHCPRDGQQPDLPAGLMGDLVRGARALRVLDVDMPTGADRAACAALRGLRHVELNVYKDDRGRTKPFGHPAVRALRAACALCVKMHSAALRSAVFSLCRGEHGLYGVQWQRQLRRVVDEFSAKMPRVEMELLVDGPNCDVCGESWDCPGLEWPLDCDPNCDCAYGYSDSLSEGETDGEDSWETDELFSDGDLTP